jgi:hypothetical protein
MAYFCTIPLLSDQNVPLQNLSAPQIMAKMLKTKASIKNFACYYAALFLGHPAR